MIARRLLLAVGGLVLGGLARGAHAAPVLRVGDQKGGASSLMRAAGMLDVPDHAIAWSQFPAAAPVLEALNAGAVDVALAGDAPTTFALAAGVPARIVSAIRTSGAGTAIMVGRDSPLHTVGDFKGRRIAVNRGSIGHALVLAVMAAQGWGAGDVTIANLLPAEAKTALSAGAVDAWCSWGVYVAQAKLADGVRVIVDGSAGRISGLSYMVANETAIAGLRAPLIDFLRRLADARSWAAAHPDAYAKVLAAEIGVSEPVARLVFDTDAATTVPIDAQVIADAQRTADQFQQAGVIHRRLDAQKVFDPSFNAALSG